MLNKPFRYDANMLIGSIEVLERIFLFTLVGRIEKSNHDPICFLACAWS